MALGLGLAMFVGCGGSRSDLAQVSGTVTLDGQPLANALVEFIPQGGTGVVSLGRTDDGGQYTMLATRSASGASIGVNQVRITTFEILDDGGKQTVVPEKVPTKYNSATELTVTVASGRNTHDFALSTAGGKVEKIKLSPAAVQ